MAYNFGVIGCGTVAGYGHIPTLATMRGARLAAVCDSDPERALRVHEEYGAAAYSDYRTMLASEELDAVAVATHVDTHAAVALAAVERGIHVLCEKPFTKTRSQAEKVIAAARDRGVIVAVNLGFRVSDREQKVHKLVADGAVGQIRLLRYVLNWHAHQWRDRPRIRSFMAGGGPMVDSGVHFMDLCRWHTGAEFRSITADGVFIPEFDAPIHCIATARMTNDALCLVETGWDYGHNTQDKASFNQHEIIGDKGFIAYNSSDPRLLLHTGRSTREIGFKDDGKNFEAVYRRFIKSMKTGRIEALAGAEDGMAATLAAMSALKSARRRP